MPDGDLKRIPSIADRPASASVENQIREQTARDLTKLKEATDALQQLARKTGPITKRDLEPILTLLTQAVTNAPANYAYAAQRVSEHLDEVKAKVATDLHAIADSLAVKLGVATRELLPSNFSDTPSDKPTSIAPPADRS